MEHVWEDELSREELCVGITAHSGRLSLEKYALSDLGPPTISLFVTPHWAAGHPMTVIGHCSPNAWNFDPKIINISDWLLSTSGPWATRYTTKSIDVGSIGS